jgi:hypothetical protein
LSLTITSPKKSDERFIIHTFLDSYRKNHYAGPIPYGMWSKVMEPVARTLMLGTNVRTLVARQPNEENTSVDLYGWIAAKHDIVVYVYVKALYRKMGVARALLKAAEVPKNFTYSCSTKDCRSIHKAGKMPEARFDPLAIRR